MKPLSEKELIDMVTHYLRQESVAYGIRAEKIVHTFIQDRKAWGEYVIGEDERIDIQSEFDKIDVLYLETDKYPGLDGVRQASRNLLRGWQRKRNQGEKTDEY